MAITRKNKTEVATTELPVAPTATVSTENEATKEAEATTKNETPEEAGTTNETETPKEEAAKKGDEVVTPETERNISSGETADISSGEEKTEAAPVVSITPPNNCGVDNQLPVSTEEAIREVQNKIANLKETREQNLNVSSIVLAVDNEIKDLEIMLSE